MIDCLYKYILNEVKFSVQMVAIEVSSNGAFK